jgi:adenylate kinase family enzyme
LIINLRGTHGSGKTYVSHELIRRYSNEAVIDPEYVQEKHFVKPNAHVFGPDLAIIGRYKSGMDGIFPQTIVEEMIEYWANKSTSVIWENVMVSANVGRWCDLTHKLNPVNHGVWLFFDTPLQLCIDRVFERRTQSAERGFNHRQEDSDVKLDVLAGHWRRCRRAAVRAYKEGIDVRWVDHTISYEQVHNLLTLQGGWNSGGDSYQNYAGDYIAAPKSWTPTEEEMELVLETARLPWEPEDTVTKVDFKSPPKKFKSNLNDQLGVKVRKWGAGIADEDQLGTLVSDWSAYQRSLRERRHNRIGEST